MIVTTTVCEWLIAPYASPAIAALPHYLERNRPAPAAPAGLRSLGLGRRTSAVQQPEEDSHVPLRAGREEPLVAEQPSGDMTQVLRLTTDTAVISEPGPEPTRKRTSAHVWRVPRVCR
ncbi:hypothetical protein [Streptomyces brevispora]|uniref:Uncharacterized protein n=1 Tax=Streptomyces brevispora TaxID=887462 RepID=A0ABZ1GDV4_9ACTN|nr:hypothetical protein [Streptomyces brevispora]WSC18142.1 hypothetical protein OIE64_18700 [Streptomyces brevispora]